MHSTLSYSQRLSNPVGWVANDLYTRACRRGQRGELWATLMGRSRELLALTDVNAACAGEARSDTGIRTVPIAQIRGSEGRSSDFDCDFNPLQEHNRERWVRIAEARERGKPLPPVALVQVGKDYFVRDGHHRISVARALGQKNVEANVLVWAA